VTDGSIQKKIIDRYFLESAMPYSKKRPINMKSVYWCSGAALFLFIVSVLFFDPEEQTRTGKFNSSELEAQTNLTLPQSKELIPSDQDELHVGLEAKSSHQITSMRPSSGGSTMRSRSAAQVIYRGGEGKDPTMRLPMGTSFLVRMINQVHSNSSSSPAIAEIIDDVYSPGDLNTLIIPRSTRAIGNAMYDESNQRIQIQFNTLVFPEGDQHSIQAIALMIDGTSGVLGQMHSGANLRRSGKLLGHFVGQMAHGMKEKQGVSQGGVLYEAGSVKNGVLSGIEAVAMDEAKSYSEDLSQTKPTMTLAAEAQFLIFLEREFNP
jgi:hypothetical protein